MDSVDLGITNKLTNNKYIMTNYVEVAIWYDYNMEYHINEYETKDGKLCYLTNGTIDEVRDREEVTGEPVSLEWLSEIFILKEFAWRDDFTPETLSNATFVLNGREVNAGEYGYATQIAICIARSDYNVFFEPDEGDYEFESDYEDDLREYKRITCGFNHIPSVMYDTFDFKFSFG